MQEVLPTFAGRVLPFDLDASQAYADLMARAMTSARAIGKADGYIAATATAHSLMVATRDVSPFVAAGLKVVNPWDTEKTVTTHGNHTILIAAHAYFKRARGQKHP
ncbi:hypothetical protein [Rhodoferax antarcticus]|uniref:Plasmid stability protein stbB n=1 Tax=Rhodoferax antarcticus ANT.BR TaxID=1111071 RepID=A0A1Q8YKC0_9BURK|nr:hypothetical protein [Rhodoferax antarcticus]OLP08397.1 plasmid stability protein stbB [Rhodoferax antarcticus ANT.BR]